MTETAGRIVLASRPVGEPTLDNFRLEEFPIPQPGPGQMLLRTLWLSLDPYMRGRMSDAPSYAKPVGIGDVMEGGTVSEVVDSTRAPIQPALGARGMPGMTAYMGLLEIGKPAAGETVVVAAASGAVGSVVGQIARIKGARAVGIAGGPDKCRYVNEELGFDACIDHRAPDFAARLAAACPKGIDVYFENVGGAVFEAVFPLLNPFARIPLCGLISMYNAISLSPGPILLPHLMRAILTKRLTFRGFIVSDFFGRYGDFMRDVSAWVGEGRIKYREDVVEGLENAPRALIGLLRGENFGKLLVRVAANDTWHQH